MSICQGTGNKQTLGRLKGVTVTVTDQYTRTCNVLYTSVPFPCSCYRDFTLKFTVKAFQDSALQHFLYGFMVGFENASQRQILTML